MIKQFRGWKRRSPASVMTLITTPGTTSGAYTRPRNCTRRRAIAFRNRSPSSHAIRWPPMLSKSCECSCNNSRMLSWETVSSPLNVHLEHYEGPLDLLLDLIRKQQIDIKDIPIATITSQYLAYMEKARELDMDLGAEFVYMAATLIHIKSK